MNIYTLNFYKNAVQVDSDPQSPQNAQSRSRQWEKL